MDDAQRLARVVAKLVSRVEPGDRVEQDANADAQRKVCPFREDPRVEPAERVALDVVHHEEDPGRVVSHVDDRNHVRMADSASRPGLLEQVAQEARLAPQVRVHQLERDIPLEAPGPARARKVHGRHSAARYREENLVATQAFGKRALLFRLHVVSPDYHPAAAPQELVHRLDAM